MPEILCSLGQVPFYRGSTCVEVATAEGRTPLDIGPTIRVLLNDACAQRRLHFRPARNRTGDTLPSHQGSGRYGCRRRIRTSDHKVMGLVSYLCYILPCVWGPLRPDGGSWVPGLSGRLLASRLASQTLSHGFFKRMPWARLLPCFAAPSPGLSARVFVLKGSFPYAGLVSGDYTISIGGVPILAPFPIVNVNQGIHGVIPLLASAPTSTGLWFGASSFYDMRGMHCMINLSGRVFATF